MTILNNMLIPKDRVDVWILMKAFELSFKYPGRPLDWYINLAKWVNLPKPIVYMLNPKLEKQHEALNWLKEIMK